MNIDSTTTKSIALVHADVLKERFRQNEKWGLQRHENGKWLAILVEEVGESAQAMMQDSMAAKETDSDDLYTELIQVAAVAQAWAEQVREERELQVMEREKEENARGNYLG